MEGFRNVQLPVKVKSLSFETLTRLPTRFPSHITITYCTFLPPKASHNLFLKASKPALSLRTDVWVSKRTGRGHRFHDVGCDDLRAEGLFGVLNGVRLGDLESFWAKRLWILWYIGCSFGDEAFLVYTVYMIDSACSQWSCSWWRLMISGKRRLFVRGWPGEVPHLLQAMTLASALIGRAIVLAPGKTKVPIELEVFTLQH